MVSILGCPQIPRYKSNSWWVKWKSPLNTKKIQKKMLRAKGREPPKYKNHSCHSGSLPLRMTIPQGPFSFEPPAVTPGWAAGSIQGHRLRMAASHFNDCLTVPHRCFEDFNHASKWTQTTLQKSRNALGFEKRT